jgi:hypothetical protein
MNVHKIQQFNISYINIVSTFYLPFTHTFQKYCFISCLANYTERRRVEITWTDLIMPRWSAYPNPGTWVFNLLCRGFPMFTDLRWEVIFSFCWYWWNCWHHSSMFIFITNASNTLLFSDTRSRPGVCGCLGSLRLAFIQIK